MWQRFALRKLWLEIKNNIATDCILKLWFRELILLVLCKATILIVEQKCLKIINVYFKFLDYTVQLDS